jgi:hypothetical protein
MSVFIIRHFHLLRLSCRCCREITDLSVSIRASNNIASKVQPIILFVSSDAKSQSLRWGAPFWVIKRRNDVCRTAVKTSKTLTEVRRSPVCLISAPMEKIQNFRTLLGNYSAWRSCCVIICMFVCMKYVRVNSV